jgi:hypothetical protein
VDVFGLTGSSYDVARTADLAKDAKGANKLYECKTFAEDLKSKMKAEGIVGEHIRIQNVSAPNVISKKNGVIGDTGFHEGIKVGDTVFDNLNTSGIKFDDWINDLDLPTNHRLGAQFLKPLDW